MSTDRNLYAGLEVGSHTVKVVIGEVYLDGMVKIIGWGSAPSKGFSAGSITDMSAAMSSIKRAITEAEMMADCEIEKLTLAISNEHIISYNELGQAPLDHGVVTQDRIEYAVRVAKSRPLPEGKEILHALPQLYQVDNFQPTSNPLNNKGHRLQAQVHLILCSTHWKNVLVDLVEQFRPVERVIYAGYASAYSALSEQEKELGVCLIEIGCSAMNIVVYHRGYLIFSRSIPYAGAIVSKDISHAYKSSFEESERVKIQYGSAMNPPPRYPEQRIEIRTLGGRSSLEISKQDLAVIISARYQELFQFVNKMLEENHLKSHLVGGFVLVGGGSQVEDVVECAQSVFVNAPVRLGEPNNISGLTDYVKKPSYTTVIGLLSFMFHSSVELQKENRANRFLHRAVQYIKENFFVK